MNTTNHTDEREVHIGIIGGSGLGDRLVEGFAEASKTVDVATPFGSPSGQIQTGSLPDGTQLSMLARHGDGHILNPTQIPYRANIYALKSLGVTHLIASGAVGSLREQIRPGDVAIVDQFIDKTSRRISTFFDSAAVHVEFAHPCCAMLRRWLIDASEFIDVHCHMSGTYVCMEGPAFSTIAESEMHRSWGGDLIGMTAMPEARLAREAEMAYALVALPTDYDCWTKDPSQTSRPDSLLEEIIGNLNAASEACVQLIRKAIEDVSPLRTNPSAAHNALKLAIWSDKSQIPTEEIKRLDVLWGKYFDE